MKIMLDTNVIISALIFGGKAGKLLELLFDSEHELYVSEYIDKEFLEAKLDKPLIYSPGMMYDYLSSE